MTKAWKTAIAMMQASKPVPAATAVYVSSWLSIAAEGGNGADGAGDPFAL